MIDAELHDRMDGTWVLRTEAREPWPRSYLGNGLLAAQVVAEGGLAGENGTALHLMAGLYDRAAGKEVEHPVPLPAWSGLELRLRGQPLRPAGATEYLQALDLRGGTAETQHSWYRDTAVVRAVTLQAVLRQEAHLALIRLRLEADRPCEVEVHAPLDAAGGQALRDVSAGADGECVWTEARTLERGIGLAVAGMLYAEGQDGDAEPGGATLRVRLSSGQVETIVWLVAAWSERSAPEPRTAALADLRRARAIGLSRLLVDHREAWMALWRADVLVEGDPTVQRFVRAGLFGLLCSVRAGVDASIAPMGLSSLGYNGHIFWDADTWMFPPLLLLHPDLAHGVVAYRQARLPSARARAEAEGYGGAMFPWESATDGDEVTPRSIARTGLKEHHITACVALAQWQYYLATGDRAWLAERGWPVLEAAATFWLSRVSAAEGGYAILDVICADEYAEDVDNNAFTNAAARAALLAAVAAARELGRTPPPTWQLVAEGLLLPREGDLLLEYDGYDGRTIKQADVELLTFPLEHPLTEATIRRNLETYRKATDPDGPAMGRSISAIVAAQLGRREEAAALFGECYRPHLYGPFDALAETRGNGQVNFLTGVGGALQVLLFGFAGLRLHRAALALDPLLPDGWGALRFRALQWRGRSLELTVLPGDRAELTVREGAQTLTIALRRWRPGPAPLLLEATTMPERPCILEAPGWRVQTQPDGRSWHLWPVEDGPAAPFVHLRVITGDESGDHLVLELEQRVRNGDA